MNKIYTLLFAMCLAIASSTAWAESINENQAIRIAESFMTSHRLPATGLKLAKKAPQLNAPSQAGKAAYYVFNSSQPQGGYVIIAGDDRAPAVLGYSDKGTFDAQAVPEAMQELLGSYAEQIEALSQGYKSAPTTASGPAIAPLLTSCWNQKSPHNHLLPFVAGSRAVVGCAATAMAQIMYYWKWPARPSMTIPEYTTSTYSIYMPALPPVDFNWDAMQDNYQSSDTLSEAGLAAATLSLYCAQSLEMNFQDGTSAATTSRATQMLSTYFGYKASVHTLWRLNYTTQEWNDMLYSELEASRPVIYSGSKKSGGHAFICDGYDGEGLFHINWGWNSQSNGYFLLNVLNADMQGTGSASGVYGYIYSQAAIVGIEPGEGANVFALTATDLALNSATTTRSGTNYDFRAVVTGRFRNLTSQVMTVSFGWALYQGSTFKSMLYESYHTSLRPGFYLTSSSRTLKFGSGITSGTYRIVPVYSEYYAENWRPCIGADRNYIEVVINGNTCTVTGHGNASEPNYTVNDITMEGMMHNGRPVDINVNLTNNGESLNQMMYMFVNGEFTSAGYVSLNKGETGDIPFRFVPAEAGTYTLTFSWNDDGSNPFASRTVSINAMPAANLGVDIEVLNVTSNNPRTITSRQFALKATITNNGTTTYDEDILARLCKRTNGTSGTAVQVQTKHLTLAPGETTTVDFALDNLIDGWYYFVWISCYSEGTMVNVEGTSSYLITFPEEPDFMLGDVNGDKKVDIDDVTALIDKVLGKNIEIDTLAADMDQNSKVDIDDVTALISRVLTGR